MKKIWTLVVCLNIFVWQQAEAEILKLPLYKLTPANTVTLRCITDQHDIHIAVPDRWKIERASLHFAYMNSSGLVEGSSRILIKLNDYPLSQINLRPNITEGEKDLELPPLLFEAGYNKLSFNVSQHYSMECEQPCAEDLWTTLMLDTAFVELEYSLKPIPKGLASVSKFLFDPKILPNGEVNIVLKDYSSEMVTLAGMVVSGVARRFDYKKVVFSVSKEIVPGMDNILVGDWDFTKSILGDSDFTRRELEGPLLKIMSLPVDAEEIVKDPALEQEEAEEEETDEILEEEPAEEGKAEEAEEEKNLFDDTHGLLVISGVDLDHVKLAAETLAIMSLPYPNTDELTAMEMSVPDISLYGGRLMLTPDKKYTFKNLNIGSIPFHGINAPYRDITFRLPVDFFIQENQYGTLSLNFAYGAGMRTDSVLMVLVNGKHVAAINLDNPNGDIIEGYKLNIPTFLFKEGSNSIRLRPILNPSISKNCELLRTENLFLTVFENSSFEFPPMTHLVELPNLELFFLSGYPLTRWPDGYESQFYLANSNPEIISAALNMVGFMTQKNGYPLLGLKIAFEDPKDYQGELLILGDVKSIPEHYKKLSPIPLTSETRVPYPVVRSWKDEMAMAFSKQISGIGPEKGLAMEFQSPYQKGRSIVLLTATSTGDVLELCKALLEPKVQSESKGDLMIVDLTPPDYSAVAMEVGVKYFSGEEGKVSEVDYYLWSKPHYYIAAVVSLAVLSALLIFLIVRRFRKRRMTDEE